MLLTIEMLFTLHLHHPTPNSNFLTRIVFFKRKIWYITSQLIHSNIKNVLTVPFMEKQTLSPKTTLARHQLFWCIRIHQCAKSNRFSELLSAN